MKTGLLVAIIKFFFCVEEVKISLGVPGFQRRTDATGGSNGYRS
jgi:hypothetical protein